MVKLQGDRPFEVKLGRIRSASGHAKAKSFFKKVGYGAKRASGSIRGRRTGGGRAQTRQSFHRRVIVKASIHKMAGKGAAAQRLHLDYIERDGAGEDGKKADLYTDAGRDLDKKEFLDRGVDDRHQFRFIVSPEDANEMSDLKSFTRDLMRQMESDLGTKLDWVAADHYDTGQPHVHIVVRGKRDDGHDLVIPKQYSAHGIRERAQELVSLELGPVSELEGRHRLQRMVSSERLTELDRSLLKRTKNGKLDLSSPPPKGQTWRRQLEKARLNKLKELGLAENLGKGEWRIAEGSGKTLKRMGERGDIVKAMHRAMNDIGQDRLVIGASLYDPAAQNAQSITGKIIARGVADDVNDHAYIVVDGTDGKATYINIGSSDRLSDFDKGAIITAHPAPREPRAADRTVFEIAERNGGVYSEKLHMASEERAKPEFVQAHVRRLEAMRRQAGLVQRHEDGSWRIPPDFLDRAARYEFESALRKPVRLETASLTPLSQMKKAIGATWLDRHLRDHDDATAPRGFGAEIEEARAIRRQFLSKQGFIPNQSSTITQNVLDKLEERDLQAASKHLSIQLGKPYTPAPKSGRIDGEYVQRIDRPSGRYAVIEKAKDFSLVPWREVMDRNLGKQISGIIRGKQISWTLTRGRDIS